VGARKIIVAMPKGGSGKTATAIAFAQGLERTGKTVLLVDLDPQGSATAALGAAPAPKGGYALGDLLLRPRKVFDPIVVRSGFHLVPAQGDGSLESGLRNASQFVGPLALREALARVAAGYDYVICDCAPSLAPVTCAGLAAGPVLVPVEMTRLAVAVLPRFLRTMAGLRRVEPSISILAYLPTRHVSREKESREALAALRAIGGRRVLDALIPKSTAVARSIAEGVSLFDQCYRASKARAAYLAAIDEVVSRLEEVP
jgi:chromosome partitioning protein